MNVNISPTYYCNFRCSFCYLSKEELSDKKTLPLDRLFEMLKELPSIERIELFGGELTTLPDDYISRLLNGIAEIHSDPFYVLTNASTIPWWIYHPNILLGVSYDYTCREGYHLVEKNMMEITKPFTISMVGTRCVLSKGHRAIIEAVNRFPMAHTFELKPYLPNKNNAFKITNAEYEDFIRKIILDKALLKPTFYNEDKLKYAIKEPRQIPAIKDTVFITPNGTWGDIVFDANGVEHMKEFDTLREREIFVDTKVKTILDNKYCGNCRYLGTCSTEYKDVKNMEDSCFGNYNLIEWYRTAHA